MLRATLRNFYTKICRAGYRLRYPFYFIAYYKYPFLGYITCHLVEQHAPFTLF